MPSPTSYRFSFGPWNISEGADPLGPEVRAAFPHESKFAHYRPLGFEGVQFHDDDVVPDLNKLSAPQIMKKAGEAHSILAGLTQVTKWRSASCTETRERLYMPRFETTLVRAPHAPSSA